MDDEPLFLRSAIRRPDGGFQLADFCLDADVSFTVSGGQLAVDVTDPGCAPEAERSSFLGPFTHPDMGSVVEYAIRFRGLDYRGPAIRRDESNVVLPDDGLYWNSQDAGKALSLTRQGLLGFFVEIEKDAAQGADRVETGVGGFASGIAIVQPDEGGMPYTVAGFGRNMLIVSRSGSSPSVATLWSRFRPFGNQTLTHGDYTYGDADYAGNWRFHFFGDDLRVELREREPGLYAGPTTLGELAVDCRGDEDDIFERICELRLDDGLVDYFLSISNLHDRLISFPPGVNVFGVQLD